MASSLDHDGMAPNKPSHPDLHCLYRYLLRSARKKQVWGMDILSGELTLLKCFCLPSGKESTLKERMQGCKFFPFNI